MNGNSKSHMIGILSVFSAALNYAVEPMHYITSNPMQYVKFPKAEKAPRERIILTFGEWQQIIDRFPPDSRFHIPLMIGFYTGLRISETFALTWDDIDLDNRTISVNKQIVKRNFGADVRKVPPFRFVGWFADESKRGGNRHPGPPASGTLSNGKFL